jgi:hypothetical protein
MEVKMRSCDRGKKRAGEESRPREGIVRTLIHSAPVKWEDVKVSKKKPEKLIPPQK